MADTAEKTPSARKLEVAASMLEALADSDFARIATVVSDDATLSALLPGGCRQWQGAAEIAATFDRWFGDAEHCDLIDASLSEPLAARAATSGVYMPHASTTARHACE